MKEYDVAKGVFLKNDSKKDKKDKGGMGEGSNTVPNIKPDRIELPPINPPVPNRAWTAMKDGVDIEALTEEQKQGFYIGRDNML